MKYALVNGKKQKAFKNAQGICPVCRNIVTAYCGEIYVWHWKHQSSCDSWYEPETKWHLDWKEKFPENWREIVLEDDETGIRHIADVKTPEGIVIEFQNSSISSSEIRARENFYKNMVWVLNAIEFSDNFSIGSVVKRNLRILTKNFTRQKKALEKQFEKELNDERQKLKSLEYECFNLENHCSQIYKQFSKYLEHLSIVNQISEIIVKNLMQFNYIENITPYDLVKSQEIDISSYDFHDFLEEIKNVYGEFFININSLIQSLKKYLYDLEKRKSYLSQLSDSDFRKDYKIIDSNQIESNQFTNIKVIQIDSKFTLFPEIYDVDEISLSRFLGYDCKKYEFLWNVQPELKQIESKIHQIKKTIQEQENHYQISYDEICCLLEAWILGKIGELESDFNKSTDELNRKQQERDEQQFRVYDLEEEKDEKLELKILSLEVESDSQRYEIMKEYKGLYYYRWKHERKSWQSAYQPIYFDFGDEFLFEQVLDVWGISVSGYLLQKVLKKDFINHYKVSGKPIN